MSSWGCSGAGASPRMAARSRSSIGSLNWSSGEPPWQMMFLPSIFLSGYLFPLNGMPIPLQVIGQILPTTHMVSVMRGIVLRDAGLVELAPHVLALVVFAVAMIFFSVRRVSKITV